MKRAMLPVRKIRLQEEGTDDRVLELPPEERLALMWPLTRQVWMLAGKLDVGARLQRHTVRAFHRAR